MPAPDYLNETQTAIWLGYAENFPTLLEKDPELLTAFAQAAGNVQEMQQIINDQGMVLPNSRGNPSQHPLLNILKGYNREKTLLAEKIRKRHKPKKEDKDPFA